MYTSKFLGAEDDSISNMLRTIKIAPATHDQLRFVSAASLLGNAADKGSVPAKSWAAVASEAPKPSAVASSSLIVPAKTVSRISPAAALKRTVTLVPHEKDGDSDSDDGRGAAKLITGKSFLKLSAPLVPHAHGINVPLSHFDDLREQKQKTADQIYEDARTMYAQQLNAGMKMKSSASAYVDDDDDRETYDDFRSRMAEASKQQEEAASNVKRSVKTQPSSSSMMPSEAFVETDHLPSFGADQGVAALNEVFKTGESVQVAVKLGKTDSLSVFAKRSDSDRGLIVVGTKLNDPHSSEQPQRLLSIDTRTGLVKSDNMWVDDMLARGHDSELVLKALDSLNFIAGKSYRANMKSSWQTPVPFK
jgi:hypothetical protein